jgi:hypothetical protein
VRDCYEYLELLRPFPRIEPRVRPLNRQRLEEELSKARPSFDLRRMVAKARRDRVVLDISDRPALCLLVGYCDLLCPQPRLENRAIEVLPVVLSPSSQNTVEHALEFANPGERGSWVSILHEYVGMVAHERPCGDLEIVVFQTASHDEQCRLNYLAARGRKVSSLGKAIHAVVRHERKLHIGLRHMVTSQE